MKPTKESKNIAFALRKAYDLIKSGEEEYICIALAECEDRRKITGVQAELARDYVVKTMSYFVSYEIWVEYMFPEAYKQMEKIYDEHPMFKGLSYNEKMTHKKSPFRHGRLRWLKSMISFLEGSK